MSPDTSPVPAYPGLLRLDGRRFLVAGAGQGIGRQTAHALASAGARVVCLDADADAAEHVAREVDGVPAVADIRERAGVEDAVGVARSALGGLDGIVDIVGMARYAPLLDTTDEDWDWTFGIVLRHAFLLAQIGGRAIRDARPRPASGFEGPGMAEPVVLDPGGRSGGCMVFVASVSGLTSAPLHAAYGAAKAGLTSLVRTAAVELGPHGIRVNAVAPGVVWTPRVAPLLGEEGRAQQGANAPLGRIAEPRDIAAAALFLASDLAAYVSGHVLVVDGGVSAKFPYPMAMPGGRP